jgi:hypothetical protein
MKTNFFAIVFIAIFSLSVCGQEIKTNIVQSAVFKDEFKYSNIVLVENDGNGGVLVVRFHRGGVFAGIGSMGYYFEHYDSNLKLINEYDYAMKQKDSEKTNYGYIMGMILDKQEIHLIDYVYDKKEGAFICRALTSNINNFKFDSKELFRVKSEDINKSNVSFFGGGFGNGSFDNDAGASMIVNEDKSHFAITLDIKDKNSETHKLFLFDKSLNKKIDHLFKRDIKDRKFKYENIDVSKDGNTIYLLGKVFTNEQKKKKEGGKYQFELTRVTNDSEKTQVFDTDEHYSRSLKTIIFEDRLTCIGFFSDRNDNRYKGISYFELDPTTLDIKKTKFNVFTEQFMIDKYGKDKEKELKNLSFRRILITSTNEIVFNAEEFYITVQTTSTPNGGMQTRTIYHYDDIVSAKINTSGDIVWARNINKRQATSGDESFISYTSTLKGDDTYFFINTGEKVKKLRNDRIQFGQTSTKKSNLNVIRINPNGDFDYQEILDDKDSEVPFMVSDGAITGNSVFFIGRRGSKKQLLKVTL